ncbi:DUF1236 domain-containing protein [Rhodopseudomonas sp. B29]|uniref:DUF1236 domain-containing protein n=1 Tax=Rhodopseudomonas sp. B29 TaxID=95607 RepID=UPI000345518C|nr:DUF1236 domain-containing protein [Rhodopseudomonas sp. B29]
MTNRLLISVAAAALLAGGVAANAQNPGSMGGSAQGSGTNSTTERSNGSTGGEMRNRSPETASPSSTSKSSDSDKAVPSGRQAQESPKAGMVDSKSDMKRNAGNDRDGSSTTTTGQAGGRAGLSTEQRTKITTVIRKERVAPVANVNFSISVGTRVPREVHFHRLPTEIVSIYPDWRGYEFFLVRDQIVVVNPDTLEIVAVLDA